MSECIGRRAAEGMNQGTGQIAVVDMSQRTGLRAADGVRRSALTRGGIARLTASAPVAYLEGAGS